ncbi:hypothetical protein QFZ79_004210 [Arthrobacter sp. V4I6]|nr:hypothetical protein [Arthrobacter sp. V1I7]MDQ0856099.1 hypothetical protein [Arthrobacter sp. V4I6]
MVQLCTRCPLGTGFITKRILRPEHTHVEVGKNSRAPPIPDTHHVAFDSLVTGARQLFGNAVEEKLIAPDSYRLPTFRVSQLSMIGAQWLVVEIAPGPYSRLRHQRWELDWNSDLEKAMALLEKYHARQLLAPSSRAPYQKPALPALSSVGLILNSNTAITTCNVSDDEASVWGPACAPVVAALSAIDAHTGVPRASAAARLCPPVRCAPHPRGTGIVLLMCRGAGNL